jgi:CDP-6-deoxy-D-xylo-4-hexulose-3-dehydrase
MDPTVKEQIRRIIHDALKDSSDFTPGVTPIPLSAPTFGEDEILESIDSLLTQKVTLGKKVRDFENAFAAYIGSENSVMVNSGSSANLVALSILSSYELERRIQPGDEVIAPALTWSTSIFPILNIGAVPVLVDVDPQNFCIDPILIENAITKKTRAIMPVHLLGYACNMPEILRIAKENNLFVIEDACEAPGAEVHGKRVGSFGTLGTFSFFFSHHITTIEGGMIVTGNTDFANLARSMRAHGWIRERSDQNILSSKYKSIDNRFLFVSQGYNLRPTEIQGAFGIHQIEKLDKLIRVRQANTEFWTEQLSRFKEFLSLPQTRAGYRDVYFGYAITVKPNARFKREELMQYLESKRIETRPIMAGDFTQQPVFETVVARVNGELRNTKAIHERSFFIGNHQGIGAPHREYVVRCITEFMRTQNLGA